MVLSTLPLTMRRGSNSAAEAIAYTEAGLSTAEALRTVTSDGAKFMNIPKLGEVKEGYRADLTLLRANPLDDLSRLRKPIKVFKSGRLVHETPAG